MIQETLEAIFDGSVFRPDTPPDLAPNTRCTISIQQVIPPPGTGETAWEVLHRLAGTIEAPEDWAMEHDHYLRGTPRRGEFRGSTEE